MVTVATWEALIDDTSVSVTSAVATIASDAIAMAVPLGAFAPSAMFTAVTRPASGATRLAWVRSASRLASFVCALRSASLAFATCSFVPPLLTLVFASVTWAAATAICASISVVLAVARMSPALTSWPTTAWTELTVQLSEELLLAAAALLPFEALEAATAVTTAGPPNASEKVRAG